jgi:N utilization substance protein B
MGIRRKARELALQALFCMDMTGDDSPEMLQRFCDNFEPSPKAKPFFLQLVNGVNGVRPMIDKLIERFSKNWRLSRMSCVDRNILRIAAFEILFCDDIPAKVSINEAVDIGKKFGTDESGSFINGLLDSIRIDNEKHRPPDGRTVDSPEPSAAAPVLEADSPK